MQEDLGVVMGPDGYMTPLFNWNPSRTSKKIKLDQEMLLCQVREGNGFKTALGTELFYPGGRYYFQIKILKGSLIKIGVSRPEVNIQEAFSDSTSGWAIYNGELRHNSNSSGIKYGKTLAPNDIIGVALDMVEGVLQFYCNGVSWGVAFSDPKLKSGVLVAACSPIYMDDAFALRSFVRED